MKLPKITKKQKEIVELLYRYRFLNRIQIQSFVGHTDKRRVIAWLKDLREKEYVQWIYSTDFTEKSKPAIYYMGLNGVRYLKALQRDNETALYPLEEIRKRYKDNQRSRTFIDRSILLAYCGIALKTANKQQEEVAATTTKVRYGYLTEADYINPDHDYHFLAELETLRPHLYIQKRKGRTTTSYLLEIFDATLPRYRLRSHLKAGINSGNIINQDIITAGDMSAELQGILHNDTFTRIGIKVVPFGNQVQTNKGGRGASAELVPLVDNTQLFIEFLSGLSREQLQQDNKSFRLMVDVIKNLESIAKVAFAQPPKSATDDEKQAMTEYGEDSLRTFLALDVEYKRLGLDRPASYQHYLSDGEPKHLGEEWRRYSNAKEYAASYSKLENYVSYWGRNVLPEYILIGPTASLEGSKRGYFDGMHSQLDEKVQGIIGLVGPERTTQFGLEAAQAILTGIEKTIKEMDEDPTAWFASDSNRQLLETNARRLRAIIS